MRNLSAPVFFLFALLAAARLCAGEAADIPKTPESKEAKEDPAAKDLSTDDKREAEALAKNLGDVEFEVRKRSHEKLRALVFADKGKACAWDVWLDGVRAAEKDQEVLLRLPAHVELLHRYAGLYKGDTNYAGDFLRLKISLDGEFRMYSEYGKKLRSQGRVGFSERKDIVFEGVYLNADLTHGSSFKSTLILVGDNLEGTLSWGKSSTKVNWYRMDENPPADKEAGDAAKPDKDEPGEKVEEP